MVIIIAEPERERLSTRLLIFHACSQLEGCGVMLRNAIKGVACVQTSVPFRNAIKTSCLQKVVYTYVSLLFSAL